MVISEVEKAEADTAEAKADAKRPLLKRNRKIILSFYLKQKSPDLSGLFYGGVAGI